MIFLCSGAASRGKTTRLERNKSPNCLVVDKDASDDNSVVARHPDTMESLQLFSYPPQGMAHLPDSLALESPNQRAPVGNLDASLGKSGGVACDYDLAGEEFWPYFFSVA